MQRKNVVWIGVVIVLLVIYLLVPLFLKGKIQRVVRQKINKDIKAEVHWGAVSVRWMEDFPDFTTSMEDIEVLNAGTFKNDTLLKADKVVLSINFIGALFGEKVKVNAASIENPVLYIQKNADSKSNFDIYKNTINDSGPHTLNESDVAKVFFPDNVSINNGVVCVDDEHLDIHTILSAVNLDITKKDSVIYLKTEAKEMSLQYMGVNYPDQMTVGVDAKIAKNGNTFVFQDNQLNLNRMRMGLVGSFALKEGGCDFDLKLKSKDSSFSSLFDLFPSSFKEKNGDVETEGGFMFDSSIKGLYKKNQSLPDFTIKMAIDNGSFHFKKMRDEVKDITMDMYVENHCDSWDSTVVNLDKLHFQIKDKPFDASVFIKRPFSSIDVNGSVNGTIDFNDLKNSVPIGRVDISGNLQTDLMFKGNRELIKENKYNEIQADGIMQINDLAFQRSEMPHKFSVASGSIKVKPNKLELNDIACKYGSSDLKLEGEVQNYLSYLFAKGVLKANLIQHSEMFNLNDFLQKDKKKVDEKDKKDDSVESKSDLVKVPENLDCLVKMKCNRFIYDQLDAKNVKGEVHMQNGNLMMNGLAMNLLNGNVLLSGVYSTQDTLKPYVDLSFNAQSIDLNETANAFGFVKKIVPGANNTNGKVNLKFDFKSEMTPSMSLIDNSITGGGSFYANYIEIKDSKVFDDMANLLNNPKYKVLKVENVKIDFMMGEGKVNVKPFSTKAFDKTFHIEGEQGFNKSLNYKITAPVTGSDVAGALGFPSVKVSKKEYPVDVLIKGTSDDPKIDLDFSKAQKKFEKDISSSAEDIINGLLKDDKIKKSINDFFNGL